METKSAKFLEPPGRLWITYKYPSNAVVVVRNFAPQHFGTTKRINKIILELNIKDWLFSLSASLCKTIKTRSAKYQTARSSSANFLEMARSTCYILQGLLKYGCFYSRLRASTLKFLKIKICAVIIIENMFGVTCRVKRSGCFYAGLRVSPFYCIEPDINQRFENRTSEISNIKI